MNDSVFIPGYGNVPISALQFATQGAGAQGALPNASNVAPTGLGGMPGMSPQGFQFGANSQTLGMGLNALNSVGNLWGAWQASKIAKDQLNFTKDTTNTNLNNSIQSYNTALTDRARARGATEGQSSQEIQSYIDQNRLNR